MNSCGLLRIVLVSSLLAAGFPSIARGQLSVLKNAVEAKETPKPKALEAPAETRARFEQWLAEAHDSLDRLEAPNAASALPPGITEGELDDRAHDTEQMILTITRSLKNLSSGADARKALEASRTEEREWTGFKEAPPYSILMLDELLNERDAVQDKLASYEASLSNIERLVVGAVQDTKAAESAASERVIAVQRANNDQMDVARWRMDAALVKSRLTATRAMLLQSGCDTLKDRIAAAKTDISLLDRKVKIVRAKARFDAEDLAKIRKISEERKNGIRQELSALSKRLKSSMSALSKAKNALDDLTSSTPPPAPDSDPVLLAKLKFKTSEESLETVQTLTEGLESLTQLENINLKAYQDRKALLGATSLDARASALDSLKSQLERLIAWAGFLTNEMSSYAADLSKLESRQASLTMADPRFPLLNDQRALKGEKLAMVQRVAQAVALQQKLIERWVAEYSPKPGEGGFYARVSAFAATAWKTTKTIWSFEVISFEDSDNSVLGPDGKPIPVRIPIRLGLLLRALLFFTIGYWICARIANHIQRRLVRNNHMMEAQAKTLRNWSMIVVGLFLALGTLAFLRIPLTVFAFFGGALAIGLGFGMQTLIKNFISGIIVLVERKVRVGDMLDVDGVIGTVVEVNTRSSVIRSPDDVETMIPNSAFLENKVTNWTLSNPRMRRFVRVGVAYGSSPQAVMEVLTEAAGRHGLVCKTPEPFAIFEDFGDSALMFCVYYWVHMGGQGNAMIIASDLRLMIEKRFQELGISVPFPQRDVHLTSEKPLQVEWAASTAPLTDPPDE